MGTWGLGPFDNDAAADLLAEAEQLASPARPLARALRAAARAKADADLDLDDGSAAVAACELVALAAGHGAASELRHGAVASVVDRLRPAPALIGLARLAIARVIAPPSELLAAGSRRRALVARLTDLRRRLAAAGAGRGTLARPVAGDLVVLPAGPRRRSSIVVAVISSREVAVFDGACRPKDAVAHAATRPARRVPLATSVYALLAVGQVITGQPLRADLRRPTRYASAMGTLGDDYVLTSASFGGIEHVPFAVAAGFDCLTAHTLDDLRAVALTARPPERVPSPAAREAAYVAEHRVAWRARRAQTTPHAFGDEEVLGQLVAWIGACGLRNAVDVHHRLATGRQGYGRPNERAERRSYAFCGLVAWWRSRWGTRALPPTVAARLPPTISRALLARALRAARVLMV